MINDRNHHSFNSSTVASLLSFFSGFRLDLAQYSLPSLLSFFPIELAIALTGVVHFLNNIFKLMLIGGQADKQANFNLKRGEALFVVPYPAVVTNLERSFVIRVSEGQTEWVDVRNGISRLG